MNLPPATRATLTLLAAAASLSLTTGSQAQSADALIDKLLDKGILTLDEANELREETDKNFTTAYQVKSGMPEWVTSLKINGDFRGRFEGFYSDNPAFVDRNRFRYRLRLGVTAVMKDQLEVGLRLGSGDLEGIRDLRTGTDPISSNQSLQNNASKKGVFIDLAYAKWAPLNTPDWSGSLTIGKMENPFVFSDGVFDRDYTPEGAALGLTHAINEQHALVLIAGGYVLDEISADSDDPHLAGAQLRWNAAWSPKLATTAGVAGLVIGGKENLKNSDVPNINAGNTRTPLPEGALAYHYNPIVADAAVTYTLPHFPFHNAPFPIQLSGDYIYNPGAPDRNRAYSVGISFGKSGKRGLWDLSYRYKYLEGDAWYEEFVDSDFGAYYAAAAEGMGFSGYGAGTNTKGHVAKAAYSPHDAVTLTLTAIITELIDLPTVAVGTDPDSQMIRIQADAAFKF
ncbi:MAG: putative porin [Verrucomicrobia bacterium]|nr:putative porin [Verrucomicrobiota bacterium]